MKEGNGIPTKVWLAVLGGVLTAAVIGLFLVRSAQETGAQVVITWNGQVDKTVALAEEQTLIYEGENGGYNVVSIENGKVSMAEANCPDQVCVRKGATDQTADPIVCLPNSLVVEVKGQESQLDGVS